MTYQDALNVEEARREELIQGLRALVRNRPFEQTFDGRDKDWVTSTGARIPDSTAQLLRKAGLAMISDGRLFATWKAGITLRKIDASMKQAKRGGLRSVVLNRRQWFVFTDACWMLDVRDSETEQQRQLDRLDEDEVTVMQISRLDDEPVTLISDSGLYKLILRSDKPSALKVQNMLARKIMPRMAARRRARRGDGMDELKYA